MSKTLKQICDSASTRAGLGKMSSYFGSGDETLAYLANEALEFIMRAHTWQKLRKTATISMTTATSYSLPADVKYYVPDTMNANGQERFIQYPSPDNVWWYYKTHQPTGLRYKVRQTGDELEILNPDSGIDILFEYISSYPVQANGSSVGDKSEFTSDDDVWLLDDELLILDLKWRFMSIKGVEGWQTEKMILNDHLKKLIGHDGGSSTIDFSQSQGRGIGPEPYTDLYV